MEKLKGLWKEFLAFALKGNMIDLAVAVIIAGAFGKVVDSLVKNVLMELVSYITPDPKGYRSWQIGKVHIGEFLGDLVNFLVVAAAMFFVMVKLLGAVQRAARLKSDEPVTRECPFCLSTVPAKAIKCAHCTSDLPDAG